MVKLSTYNWLMIRIILDAICPSAVNTKLWYEKARSRKSNVANQDQKRGKLGTNKACKGNEKLTCEISMAYSKSAKM